MSRIGKRPVALPQGVTVTSGNGFWEVKGPKGSVRRPLPGSVTLEVADGAVSFNMKTEGDASRANVEHGTTRSLVANAVTGVSTGYKKNLKLEGTGYKAELKGQ